MYVPSAYSSLVTFVTIHVRCRRQSLVSMSPALLLLFPFIGSSFPFSSSLRHPFCVGLLNLFVRIFKPCRRRLDTLPSLFLPSVFAFLQAFIPSLHVPASLFLKMNAAGTQAVDLCYFVEYQIVSDTWDGVREESSLSPIQI